MNQRHTEFFGPDLARGPFSSQRVETSALQIATALAQLRVPLARSDDDLRSHVAFIRELADRLAPDWAAAITASVGPEVGNTVETTLAVPTGTYSLLDCWLADAPGGGLTSLAPDDVTVNVGTILETVVAGKRWLILTSTAGVADLTVSYVGTRNWHWAVSRHARVYYSDRLYFT